MERGKVSAVTGGAVTGCITDGNADQVTGRSVMTADTGVMRICCSTYQRCISMTGTALRTAHGHNTRMIKGRCRMERFPGTRMTGGTITAGGKGLTYC